MSERAREQARVDQLDFEGALAELEQRVRRLEAGDLALEEALDLYEQGVDLARSCHEKLEAAEQRVSQLVRGPKGIEDRPMQDLGDE
ncbi:MAG: exodeoxyribonuclease VII small subunit [Alphaproteobacteria bacterium]|nr:exodeoxyribonuclease VII small subunit [Myxococcales bacterium]MCB9687691.1 exodeoxyribonuclease VII small subunit [Alphaproteobacteria bacterium]MCB9697185.1 exodeoxyribonuclease VII small subunit [Alphaproteobacteria bacterium]